MEYPEFIKNMPSAEIPFEGAAANLLTGKEGQAAFFKLKKGFLVPPHSHGEQWGIMVSGELELTIGEETKVYKAGDSYYIGEGVTHSANCLTDVLAIDIFADPERYKAR